MWNLVNVNDEYYFFDLTWDDSIDGLRYHYFGLNTQSIERNHTMETTTPGISYLYDLPIVADDNFAMVEMIKDENHVSWFSSINSAFSEMSDLNGDYELELYDYGNSAIECDGISSFHCHNLPGGEYPNVNSISFIGTQQIGGLTFNQGLVLNEEIHLNSDLIFTNTSLYSINNTIVLSNINIYIKSNRITYKGKHNGVSHDYNFIGLSGSVIETDFVRDVDGKLETSSSYDVDTLELNSGPFVFKGKTANITTINCNDLNGYFINSAYRPLGFDDYISGIINIGTINLNVDHVQMLYVSTRSSVTVNIVNVFGNSTYNESRLYIETDDIINYPNINISGEITTKIVYAFNGNSRTTITDMSGTIIEKVYYDVNLYNLVDNTIFTANNIDFNNLDINLLSRNGIDPGGYYKDIKGLFVKDAFGNIIYTNDIVEVIEGDKLVKVYSLNDNVTNTYVVPDGIRVIGSRAFEGYMNLTNIALSSSVEEIEDFAFMSCDSLQEIILNEGLLHIGDYAFFRSVFINEVTIPSSVLTIGEVAFKDYPGLTINVYHTNKPVGWADAWNSDTENVVWGYE
jgi:hypothetical protein